ncbi:1 like protein [Verticillium longisporum]|nr:1 like protein [Verticillium longisporum]
MIEAATDAHYANMLWLDSIYPPEDPTKPGAARGACPTDSGVPSAVIAQNPSAHVVWSDIRYGPIGSTYDIPA